MKDKFFIIPFSLPINRYLFVQKNKSLLKIYLVEMLVSSLLGFISYSNICILLNQVPLVCWPYYYITFFTCHLFAMSSTCWNPILYGHLSRYIDRKISAKILVI